MNIMVKYTLEKTTAGGFNHAIHVERSRIRASYERVRRLMRKANIKATPLCFLFSMNIIFGI
jgi:hypothetical protein